MTGWAAKRFWTEAAPRAQDGGWAVALDGRPLRTPAKALLLLPSAALAGMVAEEWQAQSENIDPATMPATRMANSAIDKVATQHSAVAELIAAYGGSDLLCYRAGHPAELVARQRQWDPMLDWAAQALGARLVPTEGVMPVEQDSEALNRLSAQVSALPPFELAPFHDLVAITGSLVLGFAIAHRALDGETAWSLSRIDEDYQAQQWGADAEAEATAARHHQDLLFAERFLAAARS